MDQQTIARAEQLKEYAQHKKGCQKASTRLIVYMGAMTRECDTRYATCSCGLDDLLSVLQGQEQEQSKERGPEDSHFCHNGQKVRAYPSAACSLCMGRNPPLPVSADTQEQTKGSPSWCRIAPSACTYPVCGCSPGSPLTPGPEAVSRLSLQP